MKFSSKVLLMALFAGCSAMSAEAQRLTVPLSGEGWKLWRDTEASWADDALISPSAAKDLSNVPVNPPTGGWGVLKGSGPNDALDVRVPGTDLEFIAPVANLIDPRPDNVTGVQWWWRSFTVPSSQKGKKVILDFEGIRQRAEVFVDNKLVCYDYVAETPFSVDISDAVEAGKTQTLAVRITNHGGNLSWGDFTPDRWGNTDQDILPSHGFGGLTGRVNLYCVDPKAEIEDIWVKNKPAANTVDVEVTLGDYTNVASIRATISDYKDPESVHFSRNLTADDIKDGKLMLDNLTFDGAKLWDVDNPNLYQVNIGLYDAKGNLLDDSSRHFGFRWFEARGFGENCNFFLNGKRIVLRSAISWGYWAKGGIYCTKEQAEAQVKVAKDLGLNCLNFHRNIGGPLMLLAADEMGLLYWEEPGGYTSALNDITREYAFEKVSRMIKRDRNHPSLVIYNLINEFFDYSDNKPLCDKRLADMPKFHAIDPTRFLTLASGNTRGRRNQNEPEMHKSHMRPYDETLYQVGWQDIHQAGGVETWKELMYSDPDNMLTHPYYDPYEDCEITKEIWVRGEEGSLSTPTRVEKIHEALQAGEDLGWDGLFWENQYRKYQNYFNENDLYKYWGSIDSLTQTMGDVSFDHQARRIVAFRMRNAGDMYSINGWESEPYDNCSGVVDIYRNPKGHSEIMKEAGQPLMLAVRTRNQVVKSPGVAIIDFYIINEQEIAAGSYTVKSKLVGPDGQTVAELPDQSVAVTGGDTYGELLVKGIEVNIPADAEGIYTVEAYLSGTDKVCKGHDEILAVKYGPEDMVGNGAYYGNSANVPQFYKNLTGKELPSYSSEMGKLDWIIVDRSQYADAALLTASDFKDLTLSWYGDANFSDFKKKENVSSINFRCNNGSQPTSGVNANQAYSMIYEGKIVAPATGRFDFCVEGLRGFEIFLNDGDRELWHIEWLGETNVTTRTQTIALEKGKEYALKLKYKHSDGTKDGGVKLMWSRPDQVTVSGDEILERANTDGTTIFIIGNADKWLGRVAELTGTRYEGYFAVGKDWVGGIHFNIEHPIMKGLPVNTSFGWPFQSVVDKGDERYGFWMQGSKMIVGAVKTATFHIGTSVGELQYGNGHIVYSGLDIVDNLLAADGPSEVAKKLLVNLTHYSPADLFEGWTPESGRRPYRDMTVPGVVEAENFDIGGEGISYHYGHGATYKQESLDKNKPDGKGRDYVYRPEWVQIHGTYGALEWITNGDWFEYTINVEEDGDYQIESILSTNNAGYIKLVVDGEAVSERIKFQSDNWEAYKSTVTLPVSLKAGKHIFRIEELDNINIDKFRFTRIGDYGAVEYFDCTVPGDVEAENYLSLPGMTNFANSSAGNYKDYRVSKDVAISMTGDIADDHVIYVESISDGDYLTYEIEASEGYYDIYASLAIWGNPVVGIAIDGIDYPAIELTDDDLIGTESWDGSGKVDFGLALLFDNFRIEKGKHQIRITFEKGGCNFNALSFELLPPDYDMHVPGIIEAENYDESEGAYLWNGDPFSGNYMTYRYHNGVAISRSDGEVGNGDTDGPRNVYSEGDRIIHLSHTSNGNYLTYPFTVDEEADYDIYTCVANGGSGGHHYYLTIDGVDYGSQSDYYTAFTGLNAWQKYQEFKAPCKVYLSEGEHELVYHMVQAECNFDYVRFEADTETNGIVDVTVGESVDNGLWYTIDGIPHTSPVKGAVNIHNGKLYIIR